MTAGKSREGAILVPKHTIITEYRGNPITLEQGKTRVRAGHPLIKHCGADAFEPVSDFVDYEV